MVTLKINIEKKHLFLISAIFIFLVGVGIVFSYTVYTSSVPNPGHRLNDIAGYFKDDPNLLSSLGRFCQSDGTHCPADIAPSGTLCGTSYIELDTIAFSGCSKFKVVKYTNNFKCKGYNIIKSSIKNKCAENINFNNDFNCPAGYKVIGTGATVANNIFSSNALVFYSCIKK